jgi:SAM-dependent methyltransferase
MTRGQEREKNLAHQAYFSDDYFSLSQLYAMTQQIHDIHKLQPKSILEIGIGNGFVSSFIKRAGYQVTTADINPALAPDICCPISELRKYVNQHEFDLVVCCEVLEHMPFEDFRANIETICEVGNRLYMTLPNHNKSFGFGGFLKLPRIEPMFVNAYVDMPSNRAVTEEHFWEVGSLPQTTKRSLMRILNEYYPNVGVRHNLLNPYHIKFECF